ncbi:MAG TPA: class I SAM-dependent methyltransferase [Chitinophagaceae bacterium]|nr:class I SAM-dependent methyltransferase [Chitinophagaceae bacterium]
MPAKSHKRSSMPDYGVDAPRTGFTLIVAVILVLAAALGLGIAPGNTAKQASNIMLLFAGTGLFFIFLMIMYLRVEKFRHRNRMLNMLKWTGAEQVLDIGTGRGLLMIGAAKRLTTGKSVGVDIWAKRNMAGNANKATMANVKLEQVKERVELLTADAQDLPLANSSFDYVLSNLCLHNIPSKAGRIKACTEIERMLKPGGTALVSDLKHTAEYAAAFKNLGMEVSRSYAFLIAPLVLHIVKAVKK